MHFKGKWMEDHSTNHWADGLSSVIFSINTRITHTTKNIQVLTVIIGNLFMMQL
jgi:hypothetical protein